MDIEISLSMAIEPQIFVTFFPHRPGVGNSRDYMQEFFGIFHNHSTYCCWKRTENVGPSCSLCDFKPLLLGLLIKQSIVDHM